MSSATDFAQLCRLCLVKEQVNVDIFEEPDNIRQIFHKISTCLPVKLSKEDKLPKRICEGCLYKLNIAYQFWNTSVNAEKQLLQWLKQSTRKSEADFPEKVKEEIDVPGNEIENIEDFLETSLTDVNTGKSETCVENVPESSDDEPLAKRRRRLRAQTRAAPPKPAEVIVGKVELNETDGDDNSDDPDDPNYLPDGVDMSDDNEQPGPSGLGTSTSDIPHIKAKKPAVTVLQPQDNNGKQIENTQQFKCAICKDKTAYKINEIVSHYKENHRGKKIPKYVKAKATTPECDVCSKTFTSWQNLCDHMKIHDDNYHCEYCPKTFIKAIDLVLHTKLHLRQFKCIYCDFQSRDSEDAIKHFKDSHKTKPKFTCKPCGKVFEIFAWYKEHEHFENTGTKQFKCEHCEKSFVHSRYLVAHKNIVHNVKFPRYACRTCNKQYKTSSSFSTHMKRHTGELPVCDICGITLANAENLKYHMRSHAGDKQFQCAVCDKSFVRKTALAVHMRVHTGERPYKCKFCSRGFTQSCTLKIHVRTHTGEKPFVCHICNKGFLSRGMLNAHFNNCKG